VTRAHRLRPLLVPALAFVTIVYSTARAGAQAPPADPSTDDERRASQGPSFVPPRLVEKVAATYPAEALRAGLSGTVVLEIDIDEKGVVGNISVKQGAGHGFDEAAVEAAKRWKWQPATNDGAPVPSRVTYAYKFVLKTVPKAAPKPAVSDEIRIRGQALLRGARAPLVGGVVIATPKDADPRAADTPRWEAPVDDDGNFVLRGLPAGTFRIVVSGPRAKKLEVTEKLAARDVLTVRYFLEPSNYSKYETTVRADVNREEIARQTLTTEELMKMPGSFGDALRAVENLPGVARAPFNSGLIIVRGGKPTDSKVFLGAAEVPQLYHFGGLTSIVPTRLVDRIEYMAGNFGVRYGRAIAGAIDVELREGKRDRWHGSVEMNVFDIGVTAEGPLTRKKDKTKAPTLLLALRRSYVDAVLAAALGSANAPVSFTSAPVYYDYQAILDAPVGGGRLKVTLFGSDDVLKLVFDRPQDDPILTAFGTHIYFHKLQIRYTKTIGRWQLLSQLTGGYAGQEGVVGRDLRYGVGVGSLEARVEARRPLGKSLRLLVGVDAAFSNVDLNLAVPVPIREGQIPTPISASERQAQREQQNIGLIGLYAELNWKPHERVSLTPGVRFDWWSQLGGITAFDPRLSARFKLAKYTTMKVGVGHYSQSPQAIDFNRVFGNPNIRPERAIHTALGIEQGLLPGLSAELTGFYKHLYELSTTSNEFVMRDGKVAPERVANIGAGRVYGMELLLRQSVSKHFFGWVSYTLMRSERKDCAACNFRLFDFDQTHILVVALHGYLPKGWEVGLRFRYISGLPATPPYGGYLDADSDTYSPAQGPVNTTRLADFHSLDLRVDKTFLFRTWTLRLYLDIINVYNRQNQEVVQPAYDFSRTQPITGLPIIPSFGIRAEM
jgi:TonB family protein